MVHASPPKSPLAEPPMEDGEVVRFRTRIIAAGDSYWMLAWLVGTFLLLCLAVAFTEDRGLMTFWVYLLTVLPVGGFLLLSFMFTRKEEFEISNKGLRLRMSKGYPLVSRIKKYEALYDWSDIEGYSEDVNLVLGRYGYLKIGLKKAPFELWIAPLRLRHRPYFDRFTDAFRRHVDDLNRDDTERAVAVATIVREPSFFDTRMARVLSVVLLCTLVGLGLVDLIFIKNESNEWRLIYIYLFMGPLAYFFWRRSFLRK